MGEVTETSTPTPAEEKPWHSYISTDLPRTVQESTDSAIRSARSLQHSSSTQFHALRGLMPQLLSQYRTYEGALFQKVKDELKSAKEHPAITSGTAALIGLLLARGSRRFLFRHSFGRFQSEEAKFLKADKNVKEMKLSVDLMKKESEKLIERTALAEKEMNRGQNDLKNAGCQMHILAGSVRKAESDATDLMDMLRETPGREALKLRAEVASMASHLRQQSVLMDKKMLRISELGIAV